MTSFVSGGMAGATATTVLYPVEFLRTRMAMDMGGKNLETRAYRGMNDVIVSIIKSDGIRGFYQGYGISLAGSIVFRVLYLGGYDALKAEILHRKRDSSFQKMTWSERILGAQFVSVTAGTICYPLDSVRRRMMMQLGVPVKDRIYANSIRCFRLILRQEGWRGFYLGLAPNILRSVGGAILLVAYDIFKDVL